MTITMTSKIEDITPEKAQKYLDTVKKNRNLSEVTAVRYAADMKARQWGVSDSSYIFDARGNLINGQHRLKACTLAKRTMKNCVVVRGVPTKEIANMDQNKRRSYRDAIRLSTDKDASFRMVGTCKMMMKSRAMFDSGLGEEGLDPKGEWRRAPSHHEVMEYMLTHWDAIHFVERNIGAPGSATRGISIAAVLAPVARAWYGESRRRLVDFLKVMRSGESNGRADQAAIRLRNWLIGLDAHRRSGTEIYQKTEYALAAFIESESLDKLFRTGEELFLLADEKKALAALEKTKKAAVA